MANKTTILDDHKDAPKETPKFPLVDGHQVKFAFSLGGVDYYEHDDAKMAPCARMFAAMDFYNEFNMRCSREYLTAHCAAIRDNLNGKDGKIDFLNVAKLHLQMEERLQWIFEPDTAYKYASVVFFDKNEDPYDYNFKYGQEKIARWKKETPEAFFLSMPVKRLFPLLNLSSSDLTQYLKMTGKLNKAQLEVIFTMLSSEHKTNAWYSTLESLRHEE